MSSIITSILYISWAKERRFFGLSLSIMVYKQFGSKEMTLFNWTLINIYFIRLSQGQGSNEAPGGEGVGWWSGSGKAWRLKPMT